MLKPNNFGRYKKNEIIQAGYEIVTYGSTYSEIKSELGIQLTDKQRLELCIGFRCEKAWRGCVPVYDLLDLLGKLSRGEL